MKLLLLFLVFILSGCANSTPSAEEGWYQPHEEWDYFFQRDFEYDLNDEFAQQTISYLEKTWSTEDSSFNVTFENDKIYLQSYYTTFMVIEDYYIKTSETLNTETDEHSPEGIGPQIIVDNDLSLYEISSKMYIPDVNQINILFFGYNKDILEEDFFEENFSEDIEESLLMTLQHNHGDPIPLFLYPDNRETSDKKETAFSPEQYRNEIEEAINEENIEELNELAIILSEYSVNEQLTFDEQEQIDSLLNEIDDYRFAEDIEYMDSLVQYHEERESYDPLVEYDELNDYLGGQRGWIASDESYQFDFFLGSDHLFVYIDSDVNNSQSGSWSFDTQWQLIYVELEDGTTLHYDVIRNSDGSISLYSVSADENYKEHELVPAY